jgi:hypothetical protein
MTNFLKLIIKYLSGIIGILSIFSGVVLVFLHFSFSAMCGNEIYKTFESPDKKLKAVIFQRDCGATTGYSTQISIIKNSRKLPNKAGNIFTTDGRPEENHIAITWLADRKIELQEHTTKFYCKETSMNGVEITYKR